MQRYSALLLAAVCIAVFALQNIFISLTDDFALVSGDAAARPWILVTSIFLHGSLYHLLGNMFTALTMFR